MSQQFGKNRAWIFIFQQRTFVSPRRSFKQRSLIRSEPKNGSNLFQKIDIFAPHDYAAAGGDDRRATRHEFANHFCFTVPKFIFAVRFKDVCDRNSKFRRDQFIRVDAGQAGPPLQSSTDRGLSGAHHPNQHDRFGRTHRAICGRIRELKRSCDESMADQTAVCRNLSLWSRS